MVYDQNSNGDFERDESEFNEDDDDQQNKLNDERYHEKIRAAINTKLSHNEIFKLRILSLLFITFLFVLILGHATVCIRDL